MDAYTRGKMDATKAIAAYLSKALGGSYSSSRALAYDYLDLPYVTMLDVGGTVIIDIAGKIVEEFHASEGTKENKS